MRYLLAASLVLGLLAPFAAPGRAAEEPPVAADTLPPIGPPATIGPLSFEQPDTIFTSIRLTRDGVIAVDTYGHHWQYDFTVDRFIPYQPAAVGMVEGPDDIAARCTTLVQPPAFARRVTVEATQYVDGDIIALGTVIVNGWVRGSVTSVNGAVIVGASGQVDGDIHAPIIELQPGAVLGGQRIQTSPFEAQLSLVEGNAAAIVIVLTALLMLAAYLIVTLMPDRLDAVERCMTAHRWRTVVWGVLALVVVFPLALLLTLVSVVGIILTPVACFLAIAMGVVAETRRIGRRLLRLSSRGRTADTVAALSGTLILMAFWWLAVWLTRSSGPVLQALGAVLLTVAVLVSLLPVLSGLGASLLTLYGFRPYEAGHETPAVAAEAPPPAPPETPPITLRPLRRSDDSIPAVSSEHSETRRGPLPAGAPLPGDAPASPRDDRRS